MRSLYDNLICIWKRPALNLKPYFINFQNICLFTCSLSMSIVSFQQNQKKITFSIMHKRKRWYIFCFLRSLLFINTFELLFSSKASKFLSFFLIVNLWICDILGGFTLSLSKIDWDYLEGECFSAIFVDTKYWFLLIFAKNKNLFLIFQSFLKKDIHKTNKLTNLQHSW